METPDHLIPLAQLQPRPRAWLWPGRLALGELALFAGVPGRAKSLAALDLCARVTTGRPMPDGTGANAPANAVLLHADDPIADTVAPRLAALGADLGRVFAFADADRAAHTRCRLPAQFDRLSGQLAVQQPRLLLVDPLTAFLAPRSEDDQDQNVRALAALGQLAKDHHCAVILVQPLNRRDIASLCRGIGPFPGSAPFGSQWLFEFDPSDRTRLIMAPVRNKMVCSLAFRVASSPTPAAQPILDWLGPSPLDAEQLRVRAVARPTVDSAGNRAINFLMTFLEADPRSTIDIWETTRRQNVGHSKLQSARRKLHIRSRPAWVDENSVAHPAETKPALGWRLLTFWSLPGRPLSTNPNEPADSFDQLIAEQEARYPSDPLADNYDHARGPDRGD